MPHLPRPRQWGFGALLAVAVVTVPVAAQAQTGDGTPLPDDPATTSVVQHESLEDALAEVGTTSAGFRTQSVLADRLAAASTDYAARFPSAFAGVQIVDVTGQVAVVPGADGADLLIADALSRGFTVYSAPAPARELDETADRVQAWADSLPPAQRDGIATIDVDPSTGEVTVVTDDSGATPPPPADLGAGVRPGGFRPAQGSLGSSAAAPDAPPAPTDPGDPADPSDPADPLPPNSMVGGSPIHVWSPSGTQANICSLGFNGVRDGRLVNITAAHCSAFSDHASVKPDFRPGTLALQSSPTALGRFTAEEADDTLDAALVTVDAEDRPRFQNSHVRSLNTQPLALSGTQQPVRGQTLCKYGQTTGYTCGNVASVDSASTGGVGTVEVHLCAIAGDSGGVVFSGTRAVAVTSLSNAFDRAGAPYLNCDAATRDLSLRGRAVPTMVGVTVGAIEARFPGLQVGAS